MIYVAGSLAVDYVVRVERFPAPGETTLGTQFVATPGGKGANQALAARRAGSDVRFLGKTGCDHQASLATSLLKDSGVDLSSMVQSSKPTGVAVIHVDDRGENAISVVPGANYDLSPDECHSFIGAAGDSSTLLLQQEISGATIKALLQIARARGMTSILNIAPYRNDLAYLAPLADVLVANKTEFEALTGSTGEQIESAMRSWHTAQGKTLVVTLGSDGVKFIHRGSFGSAMAEEIEPVDTVGAGDTFCGYLAAGIDQKLDFVSSIKRAVTAASLACLAAGAQEAIPRVEDVNRPSQNTTKAIGLG
jgi:ribokinase